METRASQPMRNWLADQRYQHSDECAHRDRECRLQRQELALAQERVEELQTRCERYRQCTAAFAGAAQDYVADAQDMAAALKTDGKDDEAIKEHITIYWEIFQGPLDPHLVSSEQFVTVETAKERETAAGVEHAVMFEHAATVECATEVGVEHSVEVIEKASIGEPTEADSRKPSETRTDYSDVTMETAEIMEKAGIQEPRLSANAANGRNALTALMDGSVVVSGAAKIPATLDFIPSVEKLRRNRGKIVRDRRPVTRSTSRLPQRR